MKATVKYLSGEQEKEKTVENFTHFYNYDSSVEVKGSDGDGIENSVKIQKDNFISITISK